MKRVVGQGWPVLAMDLFSFPAVPERDSRPSGASGWGAVRRIDSLTGVRILAALAVLASHLPQPVGLPPVARTFMSSGYNGVTLFFVLSGFVLAWTYADRLSRPSVAGVRDFFVARFARVYPLYLAALLFAALPQLTHLPSGSWLHVLSLQTWSPDINVAYGLNGPGWSIGVESFLYLLFPVLLWGALRVPPQTQRWVIVGAAGLLAVVTGAFFVAGASQLLWDDPGSDHRWLYRTPLTRIPDFVVGIMLALVVRRGGEHRWAGSIQWVAGGG